MQVFFTLSYSGIDSNNWSQKKFHEIVTTYVKSREGVQIKDLKETCGWNAYKCLIPVVDDADALAVRKEVERLCKQVSSKCRPYYFRRRCLDENLENLSMFGLNADEGKIFREKAPPGVVRYIDV